MSAFDDPGGSRNVAQHDQISELNGKGNEMDSDLTVVAEQNGTDVQADNAKDDISLIIPEKPTNGMKEKKKRRRLDDLGFSSPGPAFLTSASISSDGGGGTESESDTNRTRPRRQSRLSTHVINGNATNGHQQTSRSISPVPNESHQNHTTVEPPKQKTVSKPSIFRNFTPKVSVQQNLHPTSKTNGKGKGVDRSVGEISRPVNGIRPNAHNDGPSRKEQLLNERRKQMDKIYKDHDILVRELFHLQKFVTLFGFDPEVALQDRSDVFERFRMDYDLATQLSGTKGGRTTRRIVSARRGDLSLPIEQKQKPSLPSNIVQNQTQNGKHNNGHKRGRLRTSSVTSSTDEAGSDAISKAREKENVHSKKRARKIIVRRSNDLVASSDNEDSDSSPEMETVTTKKKKSKFIYLPRPPVEVERVDGIPRIRVLQPPNLPPQSRFDQSLSKYFSSWHTSGDIIGTTGEWQELSQAELLQRDEREAALYSRIDELRSEGLLQSREEALKRSHQNRAREAIRTNNYWDSILSQIGPRQHQQRVELRNKIQMTKRVARMIQTYWDEKLGRGEKQRKIEERRVRALAKWTVREVRKEWKLAVNIIRARRNEREKQEKDRAGREQLRTILEQSSQMLDKQQKALLEMEAQMSDSDSESEESSLDISEEETDEEEVTESDVESGTELEEEETASDSARDDTLSALLADENDVSDESEEESDFDIIEESSGPEDIEEDDESEEEAYGSLSQLLQPGTPEDDESIEKVNGVNGRTKEIFDITSESVDFEADDELKPVKTLRTDKRDGSVSSDVNGSHTSPDGQATGDASDNADVSDEDAELERKMWEEDDDESESEDEEENSDADLPIEELKKKYGYESEKKTAELDGKLESDLAGTSDEDAELERKMWEEDESESDDDGKNSDTDMPIEELMKKYGYGVEGKTQSNNAKLDADTESESASQSKSQDSDISMEVQSDVEEKEQASDVESIRKTGSATPNDDRTSVKIKPPFLLRGNLRPYQQLGFEWLVNLYNSGSNGILADEMGLGKTIQTISLLGHLACDKGIWGPHLVVAPTSVMLNWEVEFKKFLPGFKILSYYGSQRERKEKRKGWNSDNSFNVCITSYQLILADQHILRRKAWQYLVLDEAHHIKNFRSQRWQTLLGFNSQRRLLLTGTPLQNNLMDLWSLMYFLMPNGINSADGMVNTGFSSMKDFQQWFSNPLNRAVESAGVGAVSEEMDAETKGMVSKLHVLLRPYLLRRMKSEVEREMPAKYEHVIKCRLSKRQQFLYNDFMSRAKTRESLASGNYLSIINCLMQLRKVCNHPDLFEQRPIVTSFAMNRSAVADYEIKELLVRRDLLSDPEHERESVNLDVINLHFNDPSRSHLTPITSRSLKKLDASEQLPHAKTQIPISEPIDTWTIEGYTNSMKKRQQNALASKWQHIGYLNRLRCQAIPPHHFDHDTINILKRFGNGDRFAPFSLAHDNHKSHLTRCDSVHKLILSNEDRREAVQGFIDRFAFVTPRAVSTDMPKWALPGFDHSTIPAPAQEVSFDTLHRPAVKLQIAFPDASLLQYDCGKMQELAKLMDECKYGSHRILIFTQMTKVLDILEIWLNFNGFNYLRLDGQTKVEDRQSLTEKFNRDDRIKAFILSTRSGGLGINLTGADRVLFWDIDWNYQIEAQCMDRAHRIGQTRDVHIYRFVSEHTIEENMLKKSQEKRLLDAMVIQDGEFNTEGLSKMSWVESMFDEGGRSIAGVRVGGGGAEEQSDGPKNISDKRIEQAMDDAEDEEDARAAREARAEIHVIDDEFAEEMDAKEGEDNAKPDSVPESREVSMPLDAEGINYEEDQYVEEEEGGTIDDYILQFVDTDWDYFSTI